MTQQAHKDTQRPVLNPRATEYQLFDQVTGALINAQRVGTEAEPFAEAVDWNHTLWRTLAADCMDDRNSLTQDVRANIVSLSMWVTKYSKQIAREDASLDPLIAINRAIMQGLRDAT